MRLVPIKKITAALVLVAVAKPGQAMVLLDQLLSPNFFASQGGIASVRTPDALSWVQSPALLAQVPHTHVSSGTYLVHARLNPVPREASASGAQVFGLAARGLSGVLGAAVAMPLGQNVWVDTGPRQTSVLFGLSRMSSFSLGLGWAREWAKGWSTGLQIPILFRSNTTTDIYFTDQNPWARARTGVKPYFGWHLGVKKSWSDDTHLAVSYREEQASKIEFSVRGEVQMGFGLPLVAAGQSEILFEPRSIDVQFQTKKDNWKLGAFGRWSHWKSAPPSGLVIDSEIPNVTTEASRTRWQDQGEIALAAAYTYERWSPMLSYRYRSKAILSSNDYLDYNEHIAGLGAQAEILSGELWLSLGLRWHHLVGGGNLATLLAGIDWSL